MPDKNINTTPAPEDTGGNESNPKTSTVENDPRTPLIQEYIKDWIDQNPEFKKSSDRPDSQE